MVAKEHGSVPVTGPVRIWEGKMEGSQGKAEHSATTASTPASVPNFSWLKKDLPPATEKDDDPTLQWGDWSGKMNYEVSTSIDEDELRSATGCGNTLVGC